MIASKNQKAPTRAERERMEQIKTIGCIIALLNYRRLPCEVHHIVQGNRRLGHAFTIGLNTWTHRSVKIEGWDRFRCERELGMPLGGEHANKREFTRRYGTEMALLELQNELLGTEQRNRFLVVRRYNQRLWDQQESTA